MSTVVVMTVLAVVVVMFYYYLTTRRQPTEETDEELTEYQQIMKLDLENNYPATPREVVKLMGRIVKYLYDSPNDEEIKPLALKVRQLYDEEFLKNNPEDEYLSNLITELAQWKEKNRKITGYRLVNEDVNEDTEIDDVKYSVKYISYTIKEKGKFTEVWRVLLRQDGKGRWKIVGWEFVPAEDTDGNNED